MKEYSVLMVVPDYLTSEYGHDTYLAHVEAENVEQAQKEAQAVAVYELTPDDDPGQPEDFFVCFVCEGHVEDIKTW